MGADCSQASSQLKSDLKVELRCMNGELLTDRNTACSNI